MTSFGGSFGTERGLVFRPPSTANLMIDSADRPNPTTTTPFDFQIAKRQSILNGFFTRVATTEVVFEWCEDNVLIDASGAKFRCDISGVSPNTYSGQQTISIVNAPLPGGNFTVAEALNAICAKFNDLSGTTGATFSVSTTAVPGQVVINVAGAVVRAYRTGCPLAQRLDIGQTALFTNNIYILCPDLRPYRYIDFVSAQLTYPQDVKDASTADINRDVLCRWYFAEDNPDNLDQYGFPILMGYTRFCRRRLFNPPKYIKWDNNLPVGNLSFQLYGDDGNIALNNDPATNWLMTLQISET